MLKALIKKQIDETFSSMAAKGNGKKKRSAKSMKALMIVSLVLLVLVFTFLSISLGIVLVFEKLDSLYFIIMSVLASALGIFGSVFSTYSAIYNSKDNDLLLSMPIPPRHILMTRMIGVYAVAFMFEAVVLLPAFAVHQVLCNFNIFAFFGSLVMILLLPLFAVTVSCVLGFVLALINPYVKNKSMVTMIVSLLFFGGYFYLCMNMDSVMDSIIENSAQIAGNIMSYAYPLYCLGSAMAGDMLMLLLSAVVIIAVFALMYFILSKSYIGLTTNKRGTTKKKYVEKSVQQGSKNKALFKREISRFTHSSAYMLNCGMGSLMMIIGTAALLIFKEKVDVIAEYVPILPLACVALCWIISMNIVTAPSISLEGKTISLIRSLPVRTKDIFNSKLALHMAITAVPAFVCAVVLDVMFFNNVYMAVLMPITVVVQSFFSAVFGLAVNLKLPNLDWVNEITIFKQSMSVFVVLLSGMAIVGVLAVPYVFLSAILSVEVYIAICTAVLAAVSLLIYKWINNKGARIFEAL